METEKQQIIEAIANMNVLMLEDLLDKERTYQDTTKNIFIQKLSDTFDKFKKANDTSLMVREGKCSSKICPNRGCTGYTFIGDVSRLHMDLIFEEGENTYNDIYHCNDFSSSEIKIKSMQVHIIVSEHEKVDLDSKAE